MLRNTLGGHDRLDRSLEAIRANPIPLALIAIGAGWLILRNKEGAGRAGPDGWVHQAADMAEDALRAARESGEAMLNRAGSYAGDGASRAAEAVTRACERHPLAIGAAGMIAGMAIALLLPTTRIEDKLLGDTGDGLRRGAQEAGRQAVARVRDVGARAAARTAGDAAETDRGEREKASQA